MSTIAITGATGQLGRLVIEKLKARIAPASIIALARKPAAAAELGVTAREFDYDRPETFARALAGVDKLLIISGNEFGKRIAQHKAVIDAAKAAGVKFIAYTSLLHADTSAIHALADEHLVTEKDLKASGVAYAILRNGWYTENYISSIAGALAHGALVGAAGDAKSNAASREDYAEAAAIVLTSDGHAGKVYELAGDTAFTLSELAAEISRQTGKTIPYKNLSEAEYAAVLEGAGLPTFIAQVYAAFDTGISKGALVDDSKTLSKLLGRATRPVSETVAAVLKG